MHALWAGLLETVLEERGTDADTEMVNLQNGNGRKRYETVELVCESLNQFNQHSAAFDQNYVSLFGQSRALAV